MVGEPNANNVENARLTVEMERMQKQRHLIIWMGSPEQSWVGGCALAFSFHILCECVPHLRAGRWLASPNIHQDFMISQISHHDIMSLCSPVSQSKTSSPI